MKLPDAKVVEQYMALPWQVDAGTTEDGTRFARCREIPHAVAFAEPDEDLDALFWDSLRSSIEAMLATGEEIPAPRRMPRFSAPTGYIVIKAEHPGGLPTFVGDESYGLATESPEQDGALAGA